MECDLHFTGKAVVELLREYLEYFELDYTLSVLIPEANLVLFFVEIV